MLCDQMSPEAVFPRDIDPFEITDAVDSRKALGADNLLHVRSVLHSFLPLAPAQISPTSGRAAQSFRSASLLAALLVLIPG